MSFVAWLIFLLLTANGVMLGVVVYGGILVIDELRAVQHQIARASSTIFGHNAPLR